MDKQEYEAAQKRAVQWALECRHSFVRFLDFVKVSDPQKGGVQLEKWPHLIEVAKAFGVHRLIVILKARQIGISWLVAAYALWTAMFHAQANVLMFSLGEREATILLGKCKFVYDSLPEELKFPLTQNSVTVMSFVNGAKITALPSTEGAGRGESATLVICDEWDFHEYAEQNFAATKPTIDAGGQFIGISTRNIDVQDTFMVRTYHGAQAGSNNFHAMFIDCFARPGRTEEWFEQICREYDSRRRRSEYPRTEAEALTPFEQALVFRDSIPLLRLGQGLPRPSGALQDTVATLALNPRVVVFQPPAAGWRYQAGADPAEGIGADRSTLTIIGRKGLKGTVVAGICASDLRVKDFGRLCYDLCACYFWPMFGFENNGLGLALKEELMELRYPKLYYMDDSAREKKKPGWYTTEASKRAAIEALAAALKSEELTTPWKEQIDELAKMQYIEVETSRGVRTKAEAPRGAHDDLVMSLAIANMMPVSSSGPMPVIKFKGAGTFAMR